MQMTQSECADLATAARFGVLGTVDPGYGVHQVPVVFAIDGRTLLVPIDTVKAKTTNRLRRATNLGANRSASLLIDHRDEDWTQLWWVRINLTFHRETECGATPSALREKYVRYEDSGSVTSVLEFAIDRLVGWRAENEMFEDPGSGI